VSVVIAFFFLSSSFAVVSSRQKERMVFCSECGTKGESGARFCANCGTALAVEAEPTSAPSAGFCGGCGKGITGVYLEALGGKWHEKCFVCTDCSKPFNGIYLSFLAKKN